MRDISVDKNKNFGYRIRKNIYSETSRISDELLQVPVSYGVPKLKNIHAMILVFYFRDVLAPVAVRRIFLKFYCRYFFEFYIQNFYFYFEIIFYFLVKSAFNFFNMKIFHNENQI